MGLYVHLYSTVDSVDRRPNAFAAPVGHAIVVPDRSGGMYIVVRQKLRAWRMSGLQQMNVLVVVASPRSAWRCR